MKKNKIVISSVVALCILMFGFIVVSAVASNKEAAIEAPKTEAESKVSLKQKTIPVTLAKGKASELAKEKEVAVKVKGSKKLDDEATKKESTKKTENVKKDSAQQEEVKIAVKKETSNVTNNETKKAVSNKAEVKKDTTVKVTPKKQEKTKAPSTTVVKEKTRFVTSSNLNVRQGGGTNHSTIGSVQLGDSVTVIGQSGTWSQIKFGNGKGWVSSNFLSDNKPVVQKPSNKKPSTSNPKNESDKKPAPVNGNVADGFKTIDGNRQLILVTSDGYSTSSAKIQTFEKDSNGKWNQVMSVNGHVGKNGFATSKKEGDGKTPVGKYTIGTGFGQNGNPGTKLPFKNITSDDIWVDDSKSIYYNSWQSKKAIAGKYTSAENMNHRLYTNGFVINYNTQGTPYKGSAIFFHVGSGHTLGCVATPESNVKSIMKWMDPGKNPVIIQTPTQDLGKY